MCVLAMWSRTSIQRYIIFIECRFFRFPSKISMSIFSFYTSVRLALHLAARPRVLPDIPSSSLSQINTSVPFHLTRGHPHLPSPHTSTPSLLSFRSWPVTYEDFPPTLIVTTCGVPSLFFPLSRLLTPLDCLFLCRRRPPPRPCSQFVLGTQEIRLLSLIEYRTI